MTKSEQRRVDATVLVEGVSASVIKCKARETFTRGNVTVQAGQDFFLVRSGSDPTRYYVTIFTDRFVWECSCGACGKTHAHLDLVRVWTCAHFGNPESALVQKAKRLLKRQADKSRRDAKIAEEVQSTVNSEQEAVACLLAPKAKILQMPMPTIGTSALIADKMTKAPLNGNRGFQLMR